MRGPEFVGYRQLEQLVGASPLMYYPRTRLARAFTRGTKLTSLATTRPRGPEAAGLSRLAVSATGSNPASSTAGIGFVGLTPTPFTRLNMEDLRDVRERFKRKARLLGTSSREA